MYLLLSFCKVVMATLRLIAICPRGLTSHMIYILTGAPNRIEFCWLDASTRDIARVSDTEYSFFPPSLQLRITSSFNKIPYYLAAFSNFNQTPSTHFPPFSLNELPWHARVAQGFKSSIPERSLSLQSQNPLLSTASRRLC